MHKKKKKKKKIKSRNNIIKIVERILYFNHLNQAGQGWKILTPSSRLPVDCQFL